MNAFIGFIMLVIGMITAISPYTGWYMSLGWRLKDAEPSDLALSTQRVSGVVLVIVGMIFLLSSCSLGISKDSWPERFHERLTTVEVEKITVGFVDTVTIKEEEVQEIVDRLKQSQFESFELGTTYGFNNSAQITFEDGYSIEVIIGGPSGGVEVHPDEKEVAYKILNSGLEGWFTSHYPNH